jgi:TonB family protein
MSCIVFLVGLSLFLISPGVNVISMRTDCITVYVERGVLEFPRNPDGRPYDGVVAPSLIGLGRGSQLQNILEDLGWTGCEKVVTLVPEGETTGVDTSGEDLRAIPRILHFDDIDTRAYTIHFAPDSLRNEVWLEHTKELLLSTGVVDSVEFHPTSRSWSGSLPVVLRQCEAVNPSLGEAGFVMVRVKITAWGTVSDAVCEQSTLSKPYVDAAVEAAKKWIFTPPRQGRARVSSMVVIPFEFDSKSAVH